MTNQPRYLTAYDVHHNAHQVPVDKLFWRPSANAIIIRDNEILLCRHFGKYNLPGGGMVFGESIEDALRREVREETGAEIARPQLVAADSSLYYSVFGDPPFQSILLYYLCEYSGGTISADGFDEDERKHAELATWVDLATIDDWQITSTVDYRPYVRRALDILSGERPN